MREISPSYFHQPGHDRSPGSDPVPSKRRSTKPQKGDSTVTPVPTAPTRVAKPRKGKVCGSKKPRYVLTKALIKKALAEGYYELLDERQELIAMQQTGHDSSLNGMADKNEIKSRGLQDVLDEKKVRLLLANMQEFKIVINVGALVQAAKKDPKLYKMLQETKLPSNQSPLAKALSDRRGTAAKAIRPSMTSSHRSIKSNSTKAKKKGGKAGSNFSHSGVDSKKFH